MSSSVLALVVLVLLGTICSLFYIFCTTLSRSNHNKNGRKLPPGPRALPIIGNLHMLGKLPHQNLHHLAKSYGPIMSIRVGCVQTIVVSSPQAAEIFLKTHDTVFASRPKVQSSEFLSYGAKGMVFTEYGSYWRTVRKWCTLHLLSASKVEYYAPIRKAKLELLVESVSKAAAAGVTVDLREKVGEAIQEMMCKIIFGRSKDDTFDLKSLIEQAKHLAGSFNLSDYLPFLAPLDLQGLARRLKRTSKILDAFFEKVIDEHEQGTNGEEPKPRKDFVDVMVSLLNKPMNPHDDDEQAYIIGRENIKAILLDMIIGSIHTSATAIEWAFSELLRHPRVMARLQQELAAIVGRNRMVEESDLPKLTYLDMVVKESLRLHPVGAFLIPHESMEDITINGYFIPKKSQILVNLWSMGRDPNVWSDNAEEFFPERFIDSKIDLRGHDFQLIPFGSGRRGCPGIHVGLVTVRIVLAQLVHCFDWELPHRMLSNQLDMSEVFDLTLPMPNHLLAKPTTYRLLDKTV